MWTIVLEHSVLGLLFVFGAVATQGAGWRVWSAATFIHRLLQDVELGRMVEAD